MVLSLTDTFKLHRKRGRNFMTPFIVGEFELIVVNPDGSIAQQIKQKNLVTRYLLEYLAIIDNAVIESSTNRIIVSNDDKEMDQQKNIIRCTYTDAMEIALTSFTKDTINKTWTFRGTIAQPTVDRVVNFVGITRGVSGNQGVGRYNNSILAGTKLTSTVNQSTIQTIQVAYRLALTRT